MSGLDVAAMRTRADEIETTVYKLADGTALTIRRTLMRADLDELAAYVRLLIDALEEAGAAPNPTEWYVRKERLDAAQGERDCFRQALEQIAAMRKHGGHDGRMVAPEAAIDIARAALAEGTQ